MAGRAGSSTGRSSVQAVAGLFRKDSEATRYQKSVPAFFAINKVFGGYAGSVYNVCLNKGDLMSANELWQQGRLIRRYKRFLADIETQTGELITIHCPNTGSMRHCIAPGSACWYSTSASKTRKYPHTWEVATTPDGDLAGINTGRANGLVRQAIEDGVITELAGYPDIRAEVKYGHENSRIDFLLQGAGPDCYVEVKNVTLREAPGQGLFPDAVSTRGTRHLRELQAMVQAGARGVLVFCVQHTGIEWVQPADAIDPEYGRALRQAADAGVEILAYRARILPAQADIRLNRACPVKW